MQRLTDKLLRKWPETSLQWVDDVSRPNNYIIEYLRA